MALLQFYQLGELPPNPKPYAYFQMSGKANSPLFGMIHAKNIADEIDRLLMTLSGEKSSKTCLLAFSSIEVHPVLNNCAKGLLCVF